MIHAAFQYFREIDRQLQKILGNETAPLVLEGVDYNLPLYRNATSYGHVLDEGIFGNPEGRPAEELHAAAWEIVKPHLWIERIFEPWKFHWKLHSEKLRKATTANG